MRINDSYFSLLLGLMMVSIASPTTTEPSKMAEGRFLAETMRLALKRPGVADSLGQILPFLRVMPTRQRDQLAIMIRAALRPTQVQEGQDETSDYTLDQPNGGGDDLLTSAAAPPNSIAHAPEEVNLRKWDVEGGLPAMVDMAQSARRSNSTGVLANLLPNLDIVNLLRETVATVDGNGAMQGMEFQDRYGVPPADLRRSNTRATLSPPRQRLTPPPGSNRRHSSILSSKPSGPSPNMQPPKPYEKVVRQPSRRVILGSRDKVRPTGSLPQKTPYGSGSTINDSFKNHLQAQAGCKYFGPTVCLSVDYYPREAILNSIRQRQGLADALLVNDLRIGGSSELDSSNGKEEFSVCPSEVASLGRPQKARTKSGVWKFIVNVDDLYAQSIRMEVCSRPGHQCIHVAPSEGETFLTTSCTQVRNSHRLLAWDENRGIHVDSFEIPTCCACHLTSTPKSPFASFSMSTSSSVSTSSRPSILLNPPPSSIYKRKRPYRGGGGPVSEEAEVAESNPPKRGSYSGGLKPFRPLPSTTTTAAPPVSTTPLLPRPLSPVAVQETWGPSSHEATRPFPEIHRPVPVARQPSDSAGSGQTTPQRINYSYHPIFDFFRAGRLKDVSPTATEEEAPSTEAMASERSDDFGNQGQRRHHKLGDGWSPILPE